MNNDKGHGQMLKQARRMRAAERNFGKIARRAFKPLARLIPSAMLYRR